MFTLLGWDNKQGCPVKDRHLKGMKLEKIWRSLGVRLLLEFGQSGNVCCGLEVINGFRKLSGSMNMSKGENENLTLVDNVSQWSRLYGGDIQAKKLKQKFLQIRKLLDRIFNRGPDSD